MGVITNTVEVVDLHRYVPEYNKDGTEKHINCAGARYHVLSYHLIGGKAVTKCSEPNCEINQTN